MVTKKPKGLGRGLDALLGPATQASDAATPAGTPMMLALDQLAPGMYQPRTRMDEGALYELAESIKAQGIMQPILVRRLRGEPRSGLGGGARLRRSFPGWLVVAGLIRRCRRVDSATPPLYPAPIGAKAGAREESGDGGPEPGDRAARARRGLDLG